MSSKSRSIYISEIKSNYQYIDDHTLHIKRTFASNEPQIHHEITGANWLFVMFRTNNSSLHIRTGQGKASLSENSILYIPAYSIPEYEIHGEDIELETLAIRKNYFHTLPRHPCAFENTEKLDLLSYVNKFARDKFLQSKLIYEYENEINALASKTKSYIDNNFNRTISIKDLAIKFNTSQAVISRYFKKSYHLPPLQYLNELRIKEAIFHLLKEGRTVLETSTLLGFNDQKQFYENFKKVFKTPPSILKAKK